MECILLFEIILFIGSIPIMFALPISSLAIFNNMKNKKGKLLSFFMIIGSIILGVSMIYFLYNILNHTNTNGIDCIPPLKILFIILSIPTILILIYGMVHIIANSNGGDELIELMFIISIIAGIFLIIITDYYIIRSQNNYETCLLSLLHRFFI
jgi:hypothetical protein